MKSPSFFFVVFLFSLSICAQGYYNQENFGNRSLLLSGNVTGSVDDLGLTYYNPARIALVDNPVFSINAKAYQFSSISLKNTFRRDGKISDSRFEGVPSLLAGTFNVEKWEGHKFAYAFLTKQRSTFDIEVDRELEEGDVVDEVDELDRLAAQLGLRSKENDEWFGGTWGTRLGDNFAVGVSAFASVYSFKGNYNSRFAGLYSDGSVGLYENELSFNQSSYGLFLKLGAAWKLKGIDLGFNIDLPYIEVIKDGKFNYQRFQGGYAPGTDEYVYSNFKGLDSKRKEPLGISVGAGLPLGRNTLHFKVDWHGKVSEYDRLVIPVVESGTGEEIDFAFSEELKSVVNFGMGAEVYLSEKFNLYGSFTSDFTPVVSSASIFDLIGEQDEEDLEGRSEIISDYWHFGLGVELKLERVQITLGSTYSFASADFDSTLEPPDTGIEVPVNDDPGRINVSRWRFIMGLEFPIFGRDVEFR